MPLPGQSIVLSFLFAIVNTDEVAQFGLRFADPALPGAGFANPNTAMDAADVTALRSALSDYLSNGGNFADYGRATGVKVAVVDASEHYVYDPFVGAFATPISGSTAGIAPQESIAISLRASTTLGKGNIGRYYLPYFNTGQLAQSPYFEAVNVANLGNHSLTFLEDVTTVMSAAYGGVVPVIGSAVGAGSFKQVTRVLVGKVPDTQRRRRGSLDESYSTFILP